MKRTPRKAASRPIPQRHRPRSPGSPARPSRAGPPPGRAACAQSAFRESCAAWPAPLRPPPAAVPRARARPPRHCWRCPVRRRPCAPSAAAPAARAEAVRCGVLARAVPPPRRAAACRRRACRWGTGAAGSRATGRCSLYGTGGCTAAREAFHRPASGVSMGRVALQDTTHLVVFQAHRTGPQRPAALAPCAILVGMLRIATRAFVVDDDRQLAQLCGAHALWAQQRVAIGDAFHAASVSTKAVQGARHDGHGEKAGQGGHDERHPYCIRNLRVERWWCAYQVFACEQCTSTHRQDDDT